MIGRIYSPVSASSALAASHQHPLAIQRSAHGLGPFPVRCQADGHLDHLFRFQLGGGNGVEDVGRVLAPLGLVLGLRRGGQLQDQRRAEPCQRAERQIAAAVMRLIHDHHGPVQAQKVGQRRHRTACALYQIKRRFLLFGQAGEVIHQRARVFIDLQALGVFLAAFILTAEGLNGGHDHHRPAFDPKQVLSGLSTATNSFV